MLTIGLAPPASAAPTASFTENRVRVPVGRFVSFDARASVCDVPPCRFQWRWYRPITPTDFDRTGTSMGEGVTLRFAWATSGTKIVVLTVTNSSSTHGRATASVAIKVRNVYPVAPA